MEFPAVLIRADATREDVKFASMEDLRKFVGGWTQFVFSDEHVLVVDDDGGPLEKPLNLVGSAYYGEPIVGDIVFIEREVFRAFSATP